MGKKNKKQNWWERNVYGDLFPNTVKKHEERRRQVVIHDDEDEEDDAIRQEIDDDYNSQYEDFGSRVSDRDQGEIGEDEEVLSELEQKMNKLAQLLPSGGVNQTAIETLKKKLYADGAKKKKAKESVKSSWWEDYEKSGRWHGYSYYKKPQLSYRYVQQTANLIASQSNINIKVGNTWAIDLNTKTLTYNPTSLMYGTKGELLLTLLHEVGKLKLSSAMKELKGPWLDKYKERAYEATFVFEDLRVDLQMIQAYPSAPEVYESQGAVMKEYVEAYIARGNRVREELYSYLKNQYEQIQGRYTNEFQMWMGNHGIKHGSGTLGQLVDQMWDTSYGKSTYYYAPPASKSYNEKDLERFHKDLGEAVLESLTNSLLGKKYRTVEELNQCMNDTLADLKVMPTLEDYLAEMYTTAYDVDIFEKVGVNVDKYVDATKDYLSKSPKAATHQTVVDEMDTEVYPHIEDLLKNSNGQSDKMQQNAPKVGQDFQNNRDAFMDDDYAPSQMSSQQRQKAKGVGVRKGGNVNQRAPGEEHVPQDWADGDYTSLRESVESEIKTLVNKLTFLRREEQVTKHEPNQRRGKLDGKKLYKARFGNVRVFKRKLESTDTIRSFAFSILVDTSGSMQGQRMIHTTRALVLFAEVFEKMQIPYEIVTFRHDAVTQKGFEQSLDNAMKRKIGGLTKAADGGTNLDNGLNQLKLKNREEKNKIALVLTDGEVGDVEGYNQQFFEPWEKKLGIKSIGLGIETDDSMKELCNHNGIVLENAAEIPMHFAELLKGLIRKK